MLRPGSVPCCHWACSGSEPWAGLGRRGTPHGAHVERLAERAIHCDGVQQVHERSRRVPDDRPRAAGVHTLALVVDSMCTLVFYCSTTKHLCTKIHRQASSACRKQHAHSTAPYSRNILLQMYLLSEHISARGWLHAKEQRVRDHTAALTRSTARPQSAASAHSPPSLDMHSRSSTFT